MMVLGIGFIREGVFEYRVFAGPCGTFHINGFVRERVGRNDVVGLRGINEHEIRLP
jgi:hypothetical protein